ncbi:MAG TPA: hypothetical protein VE153_06350 [Myxococcus sp.]|nr:hypothetical protein [Myxococcus sp.]
MKHIHLVLMSVLLSASASAKGEPAPTAEAGRNILGVSLALNQWGLVGLQGERVVGSRLAVGLGLRGGVQRTEGHFQVEEPVTPGAEQKLSSYMLGVGPYARFFLTGTAPEGLWLSPRVELTRWWTSWHSQGELGWDSESEDRRWSIGGVAMLGYSAIVGRGLSLQVGAGAEVRHERGQMLSRFTPQAGGNAPAAEARGRSRAWHVRERIEASLGWAF